MRQVLTATLGALAFAALGCAATPGPGGPGPGGPNAPCTIDQTKPASVFHVEVPAAIQANQAFQVSAWVLLVQTAGFSKQSIKPGTFKATRDGGNTLTVSGEVISPEPNPAANCGFPAIALIPIAQPTTVDVAGLPAGEYVVQAGGFPETMPSELQNPEQKPIPAPRKVVTITVK